jgi:apolipoprotein D and lipocalin family protein
MPGQICRRCSLLGPVGLALVLLPVLGCVGLPDQVKPVTPFQAQRYLGQWYEIARLDHSFERGLTRVTATYSLRPEGGLKVVNAGFDRATGAWKRAEGRAAFVEGPDQGYLKVSFFGPFYGSYVVFELDQEHYQYALVAGPNKSYLWLLARTPTLDPALRDRLLARAKALGFDTGKLILVDQAPPPETRP